MKIRNNIALFGWVFTTIFLLFCGIMSYIIFRDGASNIQINPPDNKNEYPPWVVLSIMAAFWLVGIGFAAYQWRKPCVHTEVRADGMVVVTMYYPFRRDRRLIPASMFHATEVRETTDSEGDPYFECLLTLIDDTSFIIVEGHSREYCDTVCARFHTAIANKREAELNGGPVDEVPTRG
jgi:hypothetical protein